VHEINEEYNSDVLDSDVDTDKGVINVGQKFPKYRPEDIKIYIGGGDLSFEGC